METCDFPFCMRTVRRVIDAKYPSREKRVESILTKAGNIGSGRKTNSNLLSGHLSILGVGIGARGGKQRRGGGGKTRKERVGKFSKAGRIFTSESG